MQNQRKKTKGRYPTQSLSVFLVEEYWWFLSSAFILFASATKPKKWGVGVTLVQVPSVPNLEKYELQETELKEDVARYEEIGLWDDAVRYKGLEILPDAVQYEKLGFTNASIYQELSIPNATGDNQKIAASKGAADYQENDSPLYQEIGFLKKGREK